MFVIPTLLLAAVRLYKLDIKTLILSCCVIMFISFDEKIHGQKICGHLTTNQCNKLFNYFQGDNIREV